MNPPVLPTSFLSRIPAHVRYPGMVLAMLVGSVAAQVVLLGSALSDGGAQIEPHYYDRAVAWEEEQAARARITQLGYHITLSETPEAFRLELRDAARSPLSDYRGELTLTRPHLSQPVAIYDLVRLPRDESTGDLVVPRHGGEDPGLWDITIDLRDAHGRRMMRTFRRQW